MAKYNLYDVKLVKNATFKIEAESPEAAINMACQVADDDGMMWEHPVDEFICDEIKPEFYCPICGSALIKSETQNNIYYCLAYDDCGTEWIPEIKDNGRLTQLKQVGRFNF